MESKDKVIGIIFIIVGVFFIFLGIFVNTVISKKQSQTNLNQEPTINKEVRNNESNEKENNRKIVTMYTEEGTSRYIY